MARKRTRWFLSLLIVGLAAGGGYAWHAQKNTAQKQAAAHTTASVENGDIEDIVTSQGKLEPREYVDVGAQVSGQLKKVYVAIGDTVKKDRLLAEIDPEILETRVKADEAAVKTLKAQIAEQAAQVELAAAQLQRYETLIAAKAVSQDVYDTARTALQVAKARQSSLAAQLEQAQSTLEGDRVNLGYTKIYAPMDGTVVSQTSLEGQTLNASQSAPVIVQLANLDVMTVRASVAEADVTRLKTGMEVYFTTLGSGERRWNAKVKQILPTPQVVNEVVLYDVLVDVDNTDRQLMSGMSTQMFFVVARAQNVPVIPVAALGKRVREQDKDGAQAYEVKVANSRAAPREQTILVGLQDRTRAQIVSGLQAGDQVVIAAAPAASSTKQGSARAPMMGPRL